MVSVGLVGWGCGDVHKAASENTILDPNEIFQGREYVVGRLVCTNLPEEMATHSVHHIFRVTGGMNDSNKPPKGVTASRDSSLSSSASDRNSSSGEVPCIQSIFVVVESLRPFVGRSECTFEFISEQSPLFAEVPPFVKYRIPQALFIRVRPTNTFQIAFDDARPSLSSRRSSATVALSAGRLRDALLHQTLPVPTAGQPSLVFFRESSRVMTRFTVQVDDIKVQSQVNTGSSDSWENRLCTVSRLTQVVIADSTDTPHITASTSILEQKQQIQQRWRECLSWHNQDVVTDILRIIQSASLTASLAINAVDASTPSSYPTIDIAHRSLLITGPSGSGCTTLAMACAASAGLPVVHVTCSLLFCPHDTALLSPSTTLPSTRTSAALVSARMTRAVNQAIAQSPSILLIDDLHALTPVCSQGSEEAAVLRWTLIEVSYL